MVDIQIGKKQGLTQAVASKLGLSKDECKKIDVSVWQQVVREIDNEQQNINQHNKANPNDPKASIFSGGNDTSTIDKKSNWSSNFITQEGSFSLSDESWSKISGLLGKPVETKPEEKPKNKPEEKPAEAKPEAKKAEGKVLKRSVDGEKTQIVVRKDEQGRKVRHELNPDGTEGDALAATKTFGKNKYISGDFPAQTRIYERTVDGKKDVQIGVYKDDDGNKVRKLVVKDEKTGKTTLGETLIPVKTFGKNTYVTQSQFDAQAKQGLGLDAKQQMPEGVTAKYEGGEIAYYKNGERVKAEDLKASTPKPKETTPTKTPKNPFLQHREATWKNGAKGIYEKDGNEYTYTCTTSKDGKKAYQISGKYYGLDEMGMPDMSKELDKSKFE